ncbi:dTDP-4-dehydrorhamnose 3,5-epimerase [Flavobacterium sp. CYK-4]|uniref:dTDP-4-dehydrorhamnose 3,5-epimerase n=1 Tax=Flavobacterium lotistagni TaxID=2709660 RepID=UPI00140948CA|nr:dTDP-4-dehydrorhamnose 3,5-epimerase [Flavobacterium lotistagni]NHM06143.1 dTDP-4-dehydrorhamnose 3,5-epimerase [Flavobacterium lotistagni]
MNFNAFPLEGCYCIEPLIFDDNRGYFMESFNEKTFAEKTGQSIHFVQDNQSFSSKGVLRGLHYQVGEHAQSKLIRVLSGEILDIAVDIRPGSVTFGEYVSIVLSAQNQKQFFIPKGFAHGFLVLSETATIFYKCDNFYNKASEGGIIYNDPKLNIDWQLPDTELILSEKDAILPTLENARQAW